MVFVEAFAEPVAQSLATSGIAQWNCAASRPPRASRDDVQRQWVRFRFGYSLHCADGRFGFLLSLVCD
jgi:hypothetical protein